jgi:hypothetical protein
MGLATSTPALRFAKNLPIETAAGDWRTLCESISQHSERSRREQVMTGRGGQTGAAKTGGGSTSSSTSINPTINAPNTASGLDQIRLSFDETRVQSLAAQVWRSLKFARPRSMRCSRRSATANIRFLQARLPRPWSATSVARRRASGVSDGSVDHERHRSGPAARAREAGP